MSLGQRLSAVGRPCDVSQQAARSSRCSDETVGGIKASVEQSRTEQSRAATGLSPRQPVMSRQPSRGASLSAPLRRIAERTRPFLQQSVGRGRLWEGSYWITEYPSRTVVKAMDTNGEAGRSESLPRQTDKQINTTA